MSHIHGKILRTPDSAPGSKDFYKDNVAYMDKLVGKLVAELDRLKLRKNTLIIFASDNGTAPGWAAQCTIHGKPLSGCKNTMLEGGALVPMIASWPGVTPAGKVSENMTSFCDFLPTFAELTGASLPKGVTLDGKPFAQMLLGKTTEPQRESIFVLLRRNWYGREMEWKLNEAGQLFDMRNAPFAEPLVPPDSQDTEAMAARQRLQALLDELNPAGGKVDPGGGKGSKRAARQKMKAESNPPMQNGADD